MPPSAGLPSNPMDGPFLISFGQGNQKFLQVSDNKGTIRGINNEGSASVFWLEYTTDEEFKIASDWEGLTYMTSHKRSIKVEKGKEPLRFEFVDARTIHDWVDHGSRLETTAPEGYLGYNEKRDSLEIFPTDAEEKPGEVCLFCRAKEVS